MLEEGFDLFCCGGTSVDLVLRVPRLLEPGEKMIAEFVGREPGGLIANAACAAGRLGLRTGWSGLTGDDDAGREFLSAFATYNVDASAAQIVTGRITDLCVVLVEPSGERSLLIVPTMHTLPKFTAGMRTSLSHCKLGYTMPYELDWFIEFADLVHSGGGKVVIDLEASVPLRGEKLKKALGFVDIALCSEDGAKAASGKDDIHDAGKALLRFGLSLVVITLGRKGSAAFTKGQVCQVPAFEVSAVDTTGAGDCFHAAFLSGWLSEKPLEECLRIASAAAAISVGHFGPRGGYPTADEVVGFLKSHAS